MSNNPVSQLVRSVEGECVALVNEAKYDDILVPAEMNYAEQLLGGNSYAMGIAVKNPNSVRNALLNLSAIGISLNPANKHAYLVPRGNAICLDISYMGLMHLAQMSGSIEWGQAKIVYEKDHYSNNGIDKAPTHTYNAFGDRGAMVGVYCVVKTSTGAYLTEEMSKADVELIKNRSESFKRKTGPWVTDEPEMWKKTCVKRASKYWPKVDRLNRAIDYLNTDGGEGIDLSSQPKDITPISEDQILYLSKERASLPTENVEKFDKWIGKTIDSMTHEEAANRIKQLEARKAKQ